jgi:hypothetical protein
MNGMSPSSVQPQQEKETNHFGVEVRVGMPSHLPELDTWMTCTFLFTQCPSLAPQCFSQISPLLSPFRNLLCSSSACFSTVAAAFTHHTTVALLCSHLLHASTSLCHCCICSFYTVARQHCDRYQSRTAALSMQTNRRCN